jgi:hypothetical protein
LYKADGRCIKLGALRFTILSKWNSNASSVNSHAHATCLLRVGLGNIPIRAKERAVFEEDLSQTISDEVFQIIAKLPRKQDEAEMCDEAWEAVKDKFPVVNPTNESIWAQKTFYRAHWAQNTFYRAHWAQVIFYRAHWAQCIFHRAHWAQVIFYRAH